MAVAFDGFYTATYFCLKDGLSIVDPIKMHAEPDGLLELYSLFLFLFVLHNVENSTTLSTIECYCYVKKY